MSADADWGTALARWAIPPHVLAAAPDDPHGFSVERFVRVAAEAQRRPTVTHRRAAAALPDGGVVLDVGCGGGAGSLPLAGRAGRLIGVDQSAAMLDAFRRGAARTGVPVATVAGAWPDVAAQTGVADVAVCLHVAYNVDALGAFVTALTAHTRRRVVLELSEVHPLDWLRPYWRAVHGVERPTGPTADDALAVLDECGLTPAHERWHRALSLHDDDRDAQVDMIRRRLAVGEDRSPEIAALVDRIGIPADRAVMTVWWDGGAAGSGAQP